MSTPPLTKARRKTLRALCKRRYPGDRAAAKDLICTMERQFVKMPPETQDALLAQMEKSLSLVHAAEQKALAEFANKSDETASISA